jgi:hypothetical protein
MKIVTNCKDNVFKNKIAQVVTTGSIAMETAFIG